LGSSFGTAPLPWRQDRHDTRSTESRSPDDLLCNLRVSDQRGAGCPAPAALARHPVGASPSISAGWVAAGRDAAWTASAAGERSAWCASASSRRRRDRAGFNGFDTHQEQRRKLRGAALGLAACRWPAASATAASAALYRGRHDH
jgi:hypothetical protein